MYGNNMISFPRHLDSEKAKLGIKKESASFTIDLCPVCLTPLLNKANISCKLCAQYFHLECSDKDTTETKWECKGCRFTRE